MNNFLQLKLILFFLFLSLSFSATIAQDYIYSGVVQGNDGEAVIGATVVEKNSTNGVFTDDKGRFILKLNNSPATLIFSYFGYQQIELKLEAGDNLKIILKESTYNLNEVVVVGYGTTRRSTLTNAISSVKSEDFIKGSVSSPLQLLEGKVAGLAINTTSGDPNDNGVQMMLRGVSTLVGNQEPLIVIDGISGSSLSNVSVDDIESIDILKDGSAAAIYGTRGSNGVILITTKKGAVGESKTSIDYHGYASVDIIHNSIDVFSANEYRNLKATTNGFFTPIDKGASTDWMDEVLHPAFSHSHHLTLRSGNSKSNYYLGVDYKDKNGIIRNTGQEKLNVKLGFNSSLFGDKMTFSGNVNNVVTVKKTVSTGDVMFATLISNPTEAIFTPTNEYSIFIDSNNPVKLINEYKNTSRWNELQMTGKLTYSPISSLTFNMIGGFRKFNNIDGSYATKKFDTNYDGQAWRQSSANESKTFEVFGQYSERFSEHQIIALAGYSYFDYMNEGFNMYNYDFPTDILSENIIGTGMALKEGFASMGGHKSMNKLVSFFGRLNYDYNKRYLLSTSLRYEGSSKFGPKNRWGLFYSISGAWCLSEENFMKDIIWINELKLRAGYGVTGSEPSSPYLSHLQYAFGSPVMMDGNYVYTVAPNRNPNPYLKWEEKHETNIGLDFSLFKSRFSGSVDYYNRTTQDLLYDYNVPMPPNLASTTLANVGKMSNTGLEVILRGTVVQTNNIRFDLITNFSYNTNKMKSLSNDLYQRDFLELGSTGAPIQKATHIVREGGKIGDFYGWKSIGIDSNGSWIIDGGNYGENDSRQVIGNGIPNIHVGLTATLKVKNVDLTVSMQGAFDYQILNQYRMLWENFARGADHNFPKSILRNKYNQYVSTAPAYVSYYIEDGDYLKLSNVTLGYTFNLKGNKNYIRSLYVYASGSNLFKFTDYQGIDPEVNFNGLTPGVDYVSGYPTTRVILLGIKVGF